MKALIIHNPVAGQRTYSVELNQTMKFLAGRGWEVVGVEETHGERDATTYARKAVIRGCDAVLVAGGDGTIAQAVDGLVGTDTALGVLPGGTGNVFARQLNLPVPGGLHPFPVLESAHLLLDGQTRLVDVGRVSPKEGRGPTRHFLCWSGVGFDAQINRAVAEDQERKKRLGIGAFVVAAFLTLRDFAGTSATVRVDGRRVSRRLIMLVANNIKLYGVFFKMASTAVLDDGWLDVYCFQGRGPARTLLHAMRLFFKQHVQDPKVDIYRARRIEVTTYRPLPVHVDGDYIGYTPVVMEVVPHALKLIVPTCAPANLFVDGTGMLDHETTWQWMVRVVRDAQTAIKEMSGLT
jgi:YegS/Rv2252/BmrU family lipid kinase